MKKKVFFNLRKSSRERMWDTAREAVRVCMPLMPNIAQQTSLARLESYKTASMSYVRTLKRYLLRTLPLVNHQTITNAHDADLAYLWGAFPRKWKKPFVVELDNPFVLTYYDTSSFHKRIKAIKRKLRKAQSIAYLSTTARNHTLELLGDEFAQKSKVLYPFMERKYESFQPSEEGCVRFLFVGLGFRRKGGPELLRAFSQLPHENARLTVIANVDEATKAMYERDTRITFLPPQPREILFKEVYPASDVFVFPSLHESLGVVVLEALSYGMGIITTNVYATPEMVTNGENGRILPHPVLEPVLFNGVATIDCVTLSRIEFTERYLQSTLYEKLTDNLRVAMNEAMDVSQLWREQSIALFEKKFSPNCWERSLQDIIAD